MSLTIDLNGEWQLRWNDGERGERPKRILSGTADWSRAWAAKVPGSVHETLLGYGVIPEPNIGANVLACRWVEETIWYYRREFDCKRLRRGERAWLCFDTLDLAATIHLNGQTLGTHANAFRPFHVDITDFARAGKNELVVEIESGLFLARERSAEGLGLRMNHRLTKSPWLRKTQSQHGWDWSPRLLNVGIPGAVRIEISHVVRVQQSSIRADLSRDLSTGTVTARLQVENQEKEPVSGVMEISILGSRRTKPVPVEIQPGLSVLEVSTEIHSPKLWWPVGHGAQDRYEATVTLRVGKEKAAVASRHVGFRHVRINQDPHPESGRYFIVEINGKPIFCKGANYVPVDLILSRVTPEHHAAMISRALEANFNFLRVWGGGVYGSDDFYELCDASGILVWQDFGFACAKYPATDEAFLADVKQEAAWQVRRLANHPSLIVWSGNNEIEMGYWEWDFEQGVALPDHALYHLVLPRIVREEHPGCYYQASSPFSPDGEPPNADHTGDQHPWSLGFGDNDFRKYREMICRFPNEGGILGSTSLPSMRASLAGEKIGGFAWELHDNAITSWDNIPAYAPDLMLEQWLGRKLSDLSVEEYTYWAGVLQGAGLGEYIKNFRRRMFDSAAAVFWMFNDIWPCSRSWTILDWQQRRNPSFWFVRRAFAPVTVVVTREQNTVRVHGINEGAAIFATLHCGVMALAGPMPKSGISRVNLPANASTVIAEFSAKEWDRLGIHTHVAFAVISNDQGEIARDCLILPLFREMKWPQSKIKVTRKGEFAVFQCSSFAWQACLDLDGEEALPDNFFDVYPGLPTRLPWPAQKPLPKVLRIGNPLSE